MREKGIWDSIIGISETVTDSIDAVTALEIQKNINTMLILATTWINLGLPIYQFSDNSETSREAAKKDSMIAREAVAYLSSPENNITDSIENKNKLAEIAEWLLKLEKLMLRYRIALDIGEERTI